MGFHICENGIEFDPTIQVIEGYESYTSDYSGWTTGLADEDLVVVRRGSSFPVMVRCDWTGTLSGCSGMQVVNLLNESSVEEVMTPRPWPAVVDARDSVLFDGVLREVEHWTVTIPEDFPVGLYRIEFLGVNGEPIGQQDIGVAFNPFACETDCLTDEELRAYAYVERSFLSGDFDEVPRVNHGRYYYTRPSISGEVSELFPFESSNTIRRALAAAHGTEYPDEAMVHIRELIGMMVAYDTSRMSLQQTYGDINHILEMYINDGLTYEAAFEREEGYLVPMSDYDGKCNDSAALVVTFGRAIGVPTRMATGRSVYSPIERCPEDEWCSRGSERWAEHIWAEVYVTPSSETDLVGPTGWYVYDATNYMIGAYGGESEREPYAEYYEPTYVIIGDVTSDMNLFYVSEDYGL